MEAAYRDTSDWIYSVGEYSTTEQGATVLDLRKILGYHVDGMFGMEFMRGRKVEFNYADGYMRILSQDDEPAEDYVCIKCKWLDQRKSRILLPLSVTTTANLTIPVYLSTLLLLSMILILVSLRVVAKRP